MVLTQCDHCDTEQGKRHGETEEGKKHRHKGREETQRQSKGRQKDISQMKQKDSFVWTEKTTLRGIVLLLALSLYASTGSIHMCDYHRIIIIKYNALECNMSHH